jgi:hypothetical protein
MAAALGVPLVVIEGPFLASMMLPSEGNWKAVRATGLPCVGCGDFTCISPSAVVNACTEPDSQIIVQAIEETLNGQGNV